MERTVSGQRIASVQGEGGWMPWFWRPGLEAAWDKVGKVGWAHREKPVGHAISSSLVSKKRQTAWGPEVMLRGELQSLPVALGDAHIAATSPFCLTVPIKQRVSCYHIFKDPVPCLGGGEQRSPDLLEAIIEDPKYTESCVLWKCWQKQTFLKQSLLWNPCY